MIQKKKVETLNKYFLYNNYPNPFNPFTKIKYSIAGGGNSLMKSVQLKVFDIIGNEVRVLVNEEKPAGEYEVEFNGTSIPSGIYFCQLKVNGFVQTKKLMLIK